MSQNRAAVHYVKKGSNISVSVGDYFSTMLDQSMNWQDAAEEFDDLLGHYFCIELSSARPVGGKAACTAARF